MKPQPTDTELLDILLELLLLWWWMLRGMMKRWCGTG